MNILANSVIKEKILFRSYFDLCNNNKRLNIIITLNENPIDQVKRIFKKIIENDTINNGYYEIQNLFTQIQMVDPNMIINIIVDTIQEKNLIIQNAIYDDNGNIDTLNIAMYIQIWQTYKDFSTRMYHLINNYLHFMAEKNIKTGKISHDILSIIQICMFYESIVDKNKKSDILSEISENISDIDKNNVEQLIDYIESIRVFMIMKEFTNINREKLFNIIKKIMNRTNIINIICAYVHGLLKKLTNNQSVLNDSEYETTNVGNMERQTIKKIYKIISILSVYSKKDKLLACYNKFMQIRIIDLAYDNLELEIELVRRISGAFGKEESQKLIDAISDIINTKNANNIIKTANIVVKTDEYKNLSNISTKILNPILLTKNVWKIYNVSDMEPIYPLEMKCYLDIISKSYCSIYQGAYVVNWQPTMGAAQFEANFGQKKVNITCNILQAMVLLYINDNHQTTSTKFAIDTLINNELSAKIFESLFEANLIIYMKTNQTNDPIYIVNSKNYTGNDRIDVRKNFVDVFEIEKQNEDLSIKKSDNSDNEEDNENTNLETPQKKSTKKSFDVSIHNMNDSEEKSKLECPCEDFDNSVNEEDDDESNSDSDSSCCSEKNKLKNQL